LLNKYAPQPGAGSLPAAPAGGGHTGDATPAASFARAGTIPEVVAARTAATQAAQSPVFAKEGGGGAPSTGGGKGRQPLRGTPAKLPKTDSCESGEVVYCGLYSKECMSCGKPAVNTALSFTNRVTVILAPP